MLFGLTTVIMFRNECAKCLIHIDQDQVEFHMEITQWQTKC